LLRLEPLSGEDVGALVDRALHDEERGLGQLGLSIDDDALAHLVTISGGDARMALTGLEAASIATQEDGVTTISLDLIADAVQRKAIVYDRQGDAHYDVVSAFIKSIRGSDPDAALFWLARMLEAGEDPRFIVRRLIVHASEDIGLADPMALVQATAAAHAVEHVGLPEARLNLAQATIYLARAPKSNSVYTALAAAQQDALGAEPVPAHLRDASYGGARALGHGKGYVYPHDEPGHWVAQRYRPDGYDDHRYYEPSDMGDDVSDWTPGAGPAGDEPAGGVE
jgi:putative ATPase